jgi:hypothetical protein
LNLLGSWGLDLTIYFILHKLKGNMIFPLSGIAIIYNSDDSGDGSSDDNIDDIVHNSDIFPFYHRQILYFPS